MVHYSCVRVQWRNVTFDHVSHQRIHGAHTHTHTHTNIYILLPEMNTAVMGEISGFHGSNLMLAVF
jgi:hypothetical protein